MSIEKENPASQTDGVSELTTTAAHHHNGYPDYTGENAPYANGFQAYWDRGWRGILPLPYRMKSEPPTGRTGGPGIDPSYPDCCEWADEPPRHLRGGNICLRMPVDVVGIDEDRYDGKPGAQTIAEAENQWGALPPAPYSTSRTDGSRIRFYRVPPDTRMRNVVKHKGGVEIIQRHHRYAVVWPSIHPEGRPYLWYGDGGQVLDEPPAPNDLPELPDAWLDGLRDDRPRSRDDTISGADADQIVRDALTEGEPSFNVSKRLSEALLELNTPGGRYDATRDHVLPLLRLGHLGEPGVGGALAALLDAYVPAVAPARGGERAAAAEFKRMWEDTGPLLAVPMNTGTSADDRGLFELAGLPYPTTPDEWKPYMSQRNASPTGDVVKTTATQQQQSDSGATVPILERLNMRNGAWLDAQEFPPLRWSVRGIIPEGAGFIVAPPKAGKSWLVAGVGLACACGGNAFGVIAVDQRPVLYLALEDGNRRLQSRFRQILGEGQPIPQGMHVITDAKPDEAMDAIAAFMDIHRDEQPLVILDTLGKVKPPKRPGEDSYQFDYAIGTKLKDIADGVSGSTLLVVHHTRKMESADFIDAVSGTQGIAGSADFVLVLARKRHEDNAVLSVTGRDVPESEYALHTDGAVWRLDGLDLSDAAKTAGERRAAAQLGDRSMDVLATILGAAGPVSPADVSAKTGIDNDTVGKYMRRLAAEGRIAKASRGKYGPSKTVSEVSEVSETGQTISSEGVNDSHADSDTGPELSEGHRSDFSTSDTSDTSDTYTAAPRGGPYPICLRCGSPVVAGQGDTHRECRKDVTAA